MPEAPAPARATALLATAEALLDGTFHVAAGLRSRASALLARQALEQALGEFWESRAPGVHRCRVRTQIQCLAAFLGPEPVAAAATAWNRLSGACHHHPYDVAPSPAELHAWIGSVRVFCETALPQRDLEFHANA
jgi:hypothetical protein